MKTIVQIAAVALIAGGVSAAGSFYFNKQNRKPAAPVAKSDASDTEKSESQTASNTETAESNAKSDSTNEPVVRNEAREQSLVSNSEPASFGPPVAVRPPYEPNADEAGDLINKLRARASSASRQERRIAEREEVMKLIVEDLRVEQGNAAKARQRIVEEASQSLRAIEDGKRETESERANILKEQAESRRAADQQIENLRREKDEAIQSAEESLKSVREEREQLQKQLDQLRRPDGSDRSASLDGSANLKKMVEVVDTMPPEDTSKILQELVEQNKTEAVVAVLNAMKPRQSAKVISAITESKPALAADLIDRLKRLKKESTQSAESTK